MTFDEMYKNLNDVINALNSIETHGRNNLLNLGGSISLIDNVAQALKQLIDNKKEES